MGTPILRKGMLLVAMPALLDMNFRQTVVLLCEHGPEGSMGLIVNRPTAFELSKVLPEAWALRGREDAVYAGGPVQPNAVMILYRGQPTPNALPVLGDIHLASDFQVLEAPERFLKTKEHIRFYLGYAGWAPGQLEAELSIGSWGVLEGDPRLVFETEPHQAWPTIMKNLGEEWAVYADMPPDPRLN